MRRQTNKRPRRPGAAAPLTAIALGLALLALALPRFVAGLAVAPHESLLRDLGLGRAVEGWDLAAAAEDHAAALAWHEAAETRADLASLQYALARQLGFAGPLARPRLEQALANDEAAVAGNPALPYAWLRIALVRRQLEGPSPAALAALVASIERAPWLPPLAAPRASLGLEVWTRLDAAGRALVAGQVLLAAEVAPARLAAAAGSATLWRIVQDILVARPELLRAVAASRG